MEPLMHRVHDPSCLFDDSHSSANRHFLIAFADLDFSRPSDLLTIFFDVLDEGGE